MSSGHFPSEDGRFALRRVNQGEMGDGLQVWPNTSIPKNTKLLAFEVIEVFDNKDEFENYRAEHDPTWALKFGNNIYVYDHNESSAHLVNQLPPNKCNLVFKRPAGPTQRRIFLYSGDRPIKGGTPLGVRYGSIDINKRIAAELKLGRSRDYRAHLRSSPHIKMAAATAARQGKMRMRHERALKGARASVAARARDPVVARGPCGCCLM